MNKKIGLREYSDFIRCYVLKQKGSVILFCTLLLICLCLQLTLPQLLREFIDSSSTVDDISVLTRIGLAFLFSAILLNITTMFSRYVGEKISWKSTNQLRVDLLEKVLSSSTNSLDKFKRTELVERLDGDVSELNNFLSTFVFTIFSNFILLVGIFVLLALESLSIALTIVLFVLFATVIVFKIRNYSAPFWDDLRDATGIFFGQFGSISASRNTLSFTGNKSRIMQTLSTSLMTIARKRRLAFMSFSLIWISIVLTTTFSSGVAVAISSFFWAKGTLTIGTIYMIFYYTDMLTKPIESIRNQLDDLQRADAGMKRIVALKQLEQESGGDIEITNPPSSITFDNIAMQFDKKTVFYNFSCEIKKGGLTAIIGASGSGKSTLVKMVLRLISPSNGSVYIDGTNIESIRLESLRKEIFYLSQSSFSAPITVRELFDGKKSTLIKMSLEKCFLSDWLKTLEFSLDTPLKDATGSLSIGQLQLLNFAIALSNDANILILDEHTAHLDPVIEEKIITLTKELARDKIVVIIAHNDVPIRYSDSIIKIENQTEEVIA